MRFLLYGNLLPMHILQLNGCRFRRILKAVKWHEVFLKEDLLNLCSPKVEIFDTTFKYRL